MKRALSLSGAVLLAASLVSAQVPNQLGPVQLTTALSNGKCLTAASNADGAHVTIELCTGATSQTWTFADGQLKVFGNKCLDVPDGSTANGVKLQVWTCSSSNAHQKWYYTSDMHLSWTDHSTCVDLTDGSITDGNRIEMWQCGSDINQVWYAGYYHTKQPKQSEAGQTGHNDCGTTSSDDSMCQTAWINSADDFCLWAPPTRHTIGYSERFEVAYCTKSGRGTRTIPDGTLKGVHFVKTPNYVQVTGKGDFTNIHVKEGDSGGELDPHGADGNGNPIGGLVYGNSFGNGRQYHEWTSFISAGLYCFRACVGADAARNCQHIYDEMGCYWNMPANYDSGVFEDCEGDNDLPMGVYGTSTWYQGVSPTPSAHKAASSSECVSLPTVSVTPHRRKRDLEKVVARAPEL